MHQNEIKIPSAFYAANTHRFKCYENLYLVSWILFFFFSYEHVVHIDITDKSIPWHVKGHQITTKNIPNQRNRWVEYLFYHSSLSDENVINYDFHNHHNMCTRPPSSMNNTLLVLTFFHWNRIPKNREFPALLVRLFDISIIWMMGIDESRRFTCTDKTMSSYFRHCFAV